MKKYFIAALLLFSFALLIPAEEKSARPDVGELLSLMRVEKMSESAHPAGEKYDGRRCQSDQRFA
jgi:hypothetical protein